MKNVLDAIQLRSFFYQKIRSFFTMQQYEEVDTPIVVTTPGSEVHLNYFATTWFDYGSGAHPFFLRSSPEIHMKKILSPEIPKIFQIAKCFRNGGENSTWHHPEFTMLEWYTLGQDDISLIAQTDQLIRFLAEEIFNFRQNSNTQKNSFQADFKEIFRHPPKKLSVYEAFEHYAGIELLDEDATLTQKAKEKNIISVRDDDDFETAFFKILLEKIEPELKKLKYCVLYDYPPSQAALARVIQGRAKRFEFYIDGVELSNGFLELLDPIENRERFLDTNRKRLALGKEEIPLDEEFFASKIFKQDAVNCAGNALGVDRLLAVLCGDQSLDRWFAFRLQ